MEGDTRLRTRQLEVSVICSSARQRVRANNEKVAVVVSITNSPRVADRRHVQSIDQTTYVGCAERKKRWRQQCGWWGIRASNEYRKMMMMHVGGRKGTERERGQSTINPSHKEREKRTRTESTSGSPIARRARDGC